MIVPGEAAQPAENHHHKGAQQGLRPHCGQDEEQAAKH